MRKTDFCICENKDADQLRGNREADQRLCLHYKDSTIPLLPNTKFQASSHLMRLYSPVSVGPGRKPRRPVFSQQGSYEPGPKGLMLRLKTNTYKPVRSVPSLSWNQTKLELVETKT